jgi:hypothetical protein
MAVLLSNPSRRRVLRGALGALGVCVPLPFFDCVLNSNGTALANGMPLPVRFGTWFWGLGMDKEVFVPKKVGADYDLPLQIEAWKDVKQHINLYSNYNMVTDGKPLLCHYTGWVGIRTGNSPAARGDLTDPSIDVLVGDEIGGASRFRTLTATATGLIHHTYSFRNSNAINPPIVSPEELYMTLFGSEFQDPNAPEFKPKVEFLARRSVLSVVTEQSNALKPKLGAADRIRLDQYFTSLRELEQRLDLMSQKPPPAPSCKLGVLSEEATKGANIRDGVDVELVAHRHKLMSELMAMGIACNQTRVFNLTYSDGINGLSRQGLDKPHHAITHEEAADPVLGYQPNNAFFIRKAMESWAYFVKALASVPEGAGTVLDNSVVFAHSDHEFAKFHSITGTPMMTAGKAGGKMKTGLHIDGRAAVPTQLGFTLMKVMGSPISAWGKGSMRTSQVISEALV